MARNQNSESTSSMPCGTSLGSGWRRKRGKLTCWWWTTRRRSRARTDSCLARDYPFRPGEANVPARRRVPVTHRLRRGMSHQLVETWNGNQFIPVHPIDTPNLLVTRAAGPSAQQEVMLSSVEASPGVGAGPVDELPILARLYVRQPSRMNSGVAHQPASLVTLQPRM